MTPNIWRQLKAKVTTKNFTFHQAISCARELDNQSIGIYAGDHESYQVFSKIFDLIICDYHGVASSRKHKSDFNWTKIKGIINVKAPVTSTRIRVGRNLEGISLSPAISKRDRLEFETLMQKVFSELKGEFRGTYLSLKEMNEEIKQKLISDHILFMSGDENMIVAGMERDWPEGRGVFVSEDRKFSVWVNEEDHLRIISMEKGSDLVTTFSRLAAGIESIGELIYNKTAGKSFQFDDQNGFIHSCPTNLGTGMRASVHISLPGWSKKSTDDLKKEAKKLNLQV